MAVGLKARMECEVRGDLYHRRTLCLCRSRSKCHGNGDGGGDDDGDAAGIHLQALAFGRGALGRPSCTFCRRR